jgi:hypothetical protein
MWAAIIAAPETLFRLTFFDLRREHRKLLFQLPAAAVCAFSLAFITCVFQQFGNLAAVIAFIFVNRHRFLVSVNFVLKVIYVMIIRGNNQYQSRLRRNTEISILTLIAQSRIGR